MYFITLYYIPVDKCRLLHILVYELDFCGEAEPQMLNVINEPLFIACILYQYQGSCSCGTTKITLTSCSPSVLFSELPPLTFRPACKQAAYMWKTVIFSVHSLYELLRPPETLSPEPCLIQLRRTVARN